MRARRVSLLPVVVCLVASCDDNFTACTLEARAAINVEVRDSVTGAPAAAGAIGVARDGLFTDTLHAFGLTLAGAYERAGTYEVTVVKSGYRDWSVSGVEVTAGRCHVQPVMLLARLSPL